MASILVTGGCGYIGSHTALEFLANTPHKILILDNLSTGFKENFDFLYKRYKERVEFIPLDLSNTPALESFLKDKAGQIQCVLHFAASLIVEESTKNPLLYYQNNTLNTIGQTFCKYIELCFKKKQQEITGLIYITELEKEISLDYYGNQDIEKETEDFIRLYSQEESLENLFS